MSHRYSQPRAIGLGLATPVCIVLVVLCLVINGPVSVTRSDIESSHAVTPSHPALPTSGTVKLAYAGQTKLGPPGSQPYGIAYDHRSGQMFVTESPSYISVLSGGPPTVVDSISLGANSYPEGIAYDDANNTVFVGTYPNDVAVISGSTHAIVARVNVGFEAVTLAYDPTTGNVYGSGGYATNCACGLMGDTNVTVINGMTYAVSVLTWSGEYPFSPSSIVIDPATSYVTAMGPLGTGGDSVAGFNATTGKLAWEDTAGTQEPFYLGLTANSQTGALYLSNFAFTGNTVTVLNGSDGSSLGQVLLGAGGGPALAYDSKSGDLLVGEIDDEVQAFNASSSGLVATLAVGGTPAAIGVNTSSGVADVANGNTSSVAEIASNGSAVLGVSNIGGGPNAIAFDNQTGTVYVDSSDNVSVVNTTTHQVVGTVAVGANPEGILYDPTSKEIFVANMWSNTVSVISGSANEVVANVSVDSTPYALAWNSATNQVYVTCMNFTGSHALIDVISGTTLDVTATVSLGRTYPDGIAFVPSLNEIFVDNGLAYSPPSNLTVLSATTYQTLANITLPFAAAPGQIVYDPSTGDLYVAGAGYFVDGTYPNDFVVNPVNRSIEATIPVGAWPEAIESASGTTNLFDLGEYNDTVGLIDGTTDNITSTVTLPSGTFPDGIGYDPASRQVFVSDWGTDSVSFLDYQLVYPVVFTENDLPTGTIWSVALNGSIALSTTDSVSFAEPNGTYPFAVNAIFGYNLTTPRGYVTVNGTNVTVVVVFNPIPPETYLVDFTESGLPPGTNWSVTLSGTTKVSGQGEIEFPEPNGTYSFSVGPVVGTVGYPNSGVVEVNGSSVHETITFSFTCYGFSCFGTSVVEFTETGLHSGITWSVTINGSILSDVVYGTSATITLVLENGTYPFTVGVIEGYSAYPQSGSVTVNGTGAEKEITFTQNLTSKSSGSTPTFWGLSGVDWFVFVGTAVAVVAICIVVAVVKRGQGKPPPDVTSSIRPIRDP
jgi:YVTN family beta-propeller protein